jgi:hypothetical protein
MQRICSIKVRCFAVYSAEYSTTPSCQDSGVLQVFIENESVLRRPRNFFVIIDVYMYETMNIPRADWLSPSSV